MRDWYLSTDGHGYGEVALVRWERTEKGKELRRLYESKGMCVRTWKYRRVVLRWDGLCGTITGVQKDNLIAIVVRR